MGLSGGSVGGVSCQCETSNLRCLSLATSASGSGSSDTKCQIIRCDKYTSSERSRRKSMDCALCDPFCATGERTRNGQQSVPWISS